MVFFIISVEKCLVMLLIVAISLLLLFHIVFFILDCITITSFFMLFNIVLKDSYCDSN